MLVPQMRVGGSVKTQLS